jgi:hypothetical protein
MGKKAPAQPAPPDPVATAQAQSEFNIDAARTNARLNRNNVVTPQGTVTNTLDPRGEEWMQQRIREDRAAREGQGLEWGGEENARRFFADQNPYRDQWTTTTTFSPEQQRLYDQSVQGQQIYGDAALSQLQGARERLSSPFEFNGPALQSRPDFTGIGDPNQGREDVQAALLSRINPDLERERAALESRLANQGITMGSQAWNTGFQDWQRMANDARMGAVLNAGQEQSRMFGLGLQQSGFNNQSRAQALEESLALRAQPLNEAAALLSGQQVQMPQFSQVAGVNVAAPDYQAAVGQNYAGQMAGWQAESQRIGQQNAAYAQLAGQLGGAVLGGVNYNPKSGLGFAFGRN